MSSVQAFDVIVIGGGPGGYIFAIRAAQLGKKVACVEMRKGLGGTCLNVGCIPSKALLESSEHYAQAKHSFSKHGITLKDVSLDLPTMLKRKDQIVAGLVQGIAGLFKKNKITHFNGKGKLTDKTTVEVTAPEGSNDGTKQIITAPKIILATGSDVATVPGVSLDGKSIVSSTEALCFESVPKEMIVIGGGAIGLEMGSVWSRLGSKVTVIEFQPHIAAGADRQISNELLKSLKKQGLNFLLSTKVLKAKTEGSKVMVEVEDRTSAAKQMLECDKVLVAVGRKPYTDGLGLKETGVAQDPQGRVLVNDHFETNIPGIYAIGDIIRGPMLAHKAEEEGVALAEILAGQHGHVNYNVIPNVIYTWPELASVGMTEEECKTQNLEIKMGTFPFMANARARTMEEAEGLAKVIADAKTDKVLGVHIVGARASDMIAECATLMEFSGSSEDIARTCHAHPTLSEIIKEAALAVHKRTLNF